MYNICTNLVLPEFLGILEFQADHVAPILLFVQGFLLAHLIHLGRLDPEALFPHLDLIGQVFQLGLVFQILHVILDYHSLPLDLEGHLILGVQALLSDLIHQEYLMYLLLHVILPHL